MGHLAMVTGASSGIGEARGVVVSIPGAAAATAYDAVEAAQQELMGLTRTVELPGRYREEPGTATPG